MRRLAAEVFGTFALVFAGPVSGASMNPARSLAPAVAAGRLEHLWVYLAAPTLGALLAVVACAVVHGPRCCVTANDEEEKDGA